MLISGPALMLGIDSIQVAPDGVRLSMRQSNSFVCVMSEIYSSLRLFKVKKGKIVRNHHRPQFRISGKPASDELVATPAGLFPRANIHSVPEGARIHHRLNEVQLVAATVASFTLLPFVTNISPVPISGYVAYSYWKNAGKSNIGSFSTSWVVPPVPKTADGQILYIFNALVPNSFDGIFQPVLQFGATPAGGGNYWAAASWYIVGSHTYYTVPAQVEAGQNITGVMTYEGTEGSGSNLEYLWEAVFTGIPSTSLYIGTSEVFNYAYEALEIYTASGPSDLPTGSTMMANINIATQDGGHPTLNWTSVVDSADGFKIAVISSASIDGSVQITYP
ncbi:hypothetical protein CPB84DRAFT_1749274 [Gymnopilus junonius]|uniref:Uncharacterized protein n=1 Tax=Gymnopilus junonius TaxID=109634 RepID=A0A9P5TJU9_GYMJU|nr:hypothetical protein CPB84DRAFT_1749274 [Gymnopilus junonius]